MQNFLFGKSRTSYSGFNPFGSSNNNKPGIITQIKSKIQSLFLPTINPQSTIQRIQFDEDIEQELSYQFKNNLVLIERIKPNQDKKETVKRRTICSFEQFLKDELENKVSKEAQTDLTFKPNDSSYQLLNTKQQMKFKKNHAKIENPLKMEESSNQQQFKLKKNPKKKNEKEIKENFTESGTVPTLKRIKQFDNLSESSQPIKQQRNETSEQHSSQNLFENQSFGIQQQNKSIEFDQVNKLQIQQTQQNMEIQKNAIQENQIISSSTGSHTKGDEYEMLFSMQNVSFSKEVEHTSDSDSIHITNNLYKIFHSEQKKDSKLQKNQQQIELQQKNTCDSVKKTLVQQNQEQREQQQEQKEQKEQELQQEKQEQKNSQQQEQIQINLKPFDTTTINNSPKQQNQLENQNNIIDNVEPSCEQQPSTNDCQEINVIQQESIKQCNQTEPMQVLDNYYFSQTQQQVEPVQIQNFSNTEQSSFINQSNQQLQQIKNNENIYNLELKQNNPFQQLQIQQNQQTINLFEGVKNPFLQANSSITSDQINKYFQMGCSTTQNQSQQIYQNNTYQHDLFKQSTTKQLFNFDQIQPQQTMNLFNNHNIINKAMEIQQQDEMNHQKVLYNYQPIQYNWNLFGMNQNISSNVLSLFQDPNKYDTSKRVCQAQEVQQGSVNNSFNKGYKKKQRINRV